MKLLLVPLLVFALAGCTTPDGGFATPAQADDGAYIITMTSSLRFVPENAEVPLGDDGTVTIRFVHEGGGVHDVVSDSSAWTKSPRLDSGSWDLTLDETGEFPYHCHPHAANGMKGVLRVV